MKTTTLILITLITAVSAQTPPIAPKPKAAPPPLPDNVEKRTVTV